MVMVLVIILCSYFQGYSFRARLLYSFFIVEDVGGCGFRFIRMIGLLEELDVSIGFSCAFEMMLNLDILVG